MFVRGAIGWIGLILAIAAGFAIVAIPAWLIHPFRSQSQDGIQISFLLRRWSPVITVVVAVAVAAIALGLWRSARAWWRKSVLVIAVVAAVFLVWLSRQNHFEWMFQPLEGAAYEKADEATFMEDADMVLAVNINGESAAYPVRQLAYHHLVQDEVGGVPLVATY
jgi:hypothetical protein